VWPAFIVWFLMLIGIFVSLRLRRQNLRRSAAVFGNQVGEPALTPLSQALSNLVGVAGGIYLAVVLLLNFLKIPVPEPRLFLGSTVDPLAFASLWVAILQPFYFRLYEWLRYDRKRGQ
jgi:hypothetical protein